MQASFKNTIFIQESLMLLIKYLLNSKRLKVGILSSPLLWITEQYINAEHGTPS